MTDDSELEELFGLSKSKKKPKDKVVHNLHETPTKDKGVNAPRYQPMAANLVDEADLLFMPDDDGKKYILVVSDIGSRKVDAEPLATKENTEVLAAFEKIYNRGILKLPTKIDVDPGSEFQGAVKKWFTDKGIFMRVGKVGRHRQQAIVERKNQTIAKALFKRMAAQELLTHETSRQWVSDLPKLITVMNKLTAKNFKEPKLATTPVCTGPSCNLLDIGTKVRVQLEQPRDMVTGKVLAGKFRSTDLRWDPQIRIIREILLRPGSPPMYLLDGNVGKRNTEPVAYTKNQLQLVPENEQYPTKAIIRGTPTQYVIDKILGKIKIKGKIYYRIKWRGYPESEATNEPRSELIKDQPALIKTYDEQHK